MACPNCKCNKNEIDPVEYDELKEYLQDEIQEYNVVDYVNEEGIHCTYVEVEFEDYVLELEDIDTKDITLDKVIDTIIRNNMK